MLYSGLVSITFRQLTPREVVELAVRARLESIEWGGDVHVPHGDLHRAREVAQKTTSAGLRISAYGSYYRLRADEPVPFEDVLATAVELGAPTIRVWAGDEPSADTNAAERERIAQESYHIADLATQAGISISYEYHRNTLTDTRESALALLHAVSHPGLKSLWQPAQSTTPEERLADLQAVTPWLTNVHVFQWGLGGYQDRLPLSAGEDEWAVYLRHIAALSGDHDLLLEFVRDDAPEAFLEDAATLKIWLEQANAQRT